VRRVEATFSFRSSRKGTVWDVTARPDFGGYLRDRGPFHPGSHLRWIVFIEKILYFYPALQVEFKAKVSEFYQRLHVVCIDTLYMSKSPR
jgi:hypothetical protein